MWITAIAQLLLCFVVGKDTDPIQKLRLQFSLVVITGKKLYITRLLLLGKVLTNACSHIIYLKSNVCMILLTLRDIKWQTN